MNILKANNRDTMKKKFSQVIGKDSRKREIAAHRFREKSVPEPGSNKVAGLQPATLLKKDCGTGFSVSFAKSFRTLFLQDTFGLLALIKRRCCTYY